MRKADVQSFDIEQGAKNILKIAGNPAFCLDLYRGDAKNDGIIELYAVHKEWPEWWTLEKVSK